MTVRELIAALKRLPQDDDVFLSGGKNDDTDNWPITSIAQRPLEGFVVLMRELEE